MLARSVILVLLLQAVASRADVVHLKNGNALTCVILTATGRTYQLDIGIGMVTVATEQVVRVERATTAEQVQQETVWRQKYILTKKFVPVGQRDLLEALCALEAQRDGAQQARNKLAKLQQALEREAQEFRQLQAAEAGATSQLSLPDKPTPPLVAEYNRKVAEVNEVRSRIFILQQKPAARLAAMDEARRVLSHYTAAVLDFAAVVQQRKQQGPGADAPQSVTDFFRAVEARMAIYRGEIKQTSLPYQNDQRRVVVKARLNGLVDGTFVVDTGATSMCISEDLARRLHLALGPDEIPVVLADGSTRKARPVLLPSVEVGGVRVERVAALVMPQNPGAGLDGLLGMSFLMEFNVRLDPASHTLILNRFAPP